MSTLTRKRDSSVMKDGKAVQAFTHRDNSVPRKPRIPDNRTGSYDPDDPSQSDSSLPDIQHVQHKRQTKTKHIEDHVEPLKLHLPQINSANSSMTGSEKRDDTTEKEQDEIVTDSVNYSDHSILKKIQNNVIGHDLVIDTPYGHRNVVYCDFTASGRTLHFIENYIKKHVCPTYANTHSTTGHNARQTGKFREEARSIIKNCVNAGKDDVVIFTGSGATAAMHKLAWALKINQPNVAKETVVIISPYEHHSNILPWREYGTKVVRLREEPSTGLIDLNHLEGELKFWKEKRRQVLVSVSAASNVTGLITDVDAVSQLAHKYGALAVFDYAAGGPYMKIDMNPNKLGYKDAVILSPHKFVGGPGTPGIIVAKKWVFRNPVPDKVGGGTVKYVTRDSHMYLNNIEEREEGGTPAIIESIRAGLVFKLKQDVGEDLIHSREDDLCRRAFSVWEKNPNIHVLGNHASERVPIFSFLTLHTETGKLIHHNFISTLLSDLFGIQARGGCACAGPYAEDLLGMTDQVAKKFMTCFIVDKTSTHDKNSPPFQMEVMKPGFTRINLAYFYEDETIDYVIAAVDMVTKHGWKLLPQYTFDIKSGSWTHKDFYNQEESTLNTLDDADIFRDRESRMSQSLDDNEGPAYDEALELADQLFHESEEKAQMRRISSASLALRELIPRDKRKLRWFLTPSEAMNIMADMNESYLDQKLYTMPFKLMPPVQRMVNPYGSDSRGSSSGHRTHQSAGTTTRSDKDYTRPSRIKQGGSQTDRSEEPNKRKHVLTNGSHTDRSERTVKTGGNGSLQKMSHPTEGANSGTPRKDDTNSGTTNSGTPGKDHVSSGTTKKDRRMSDQIPERLTAKNRFQ